MAEYTLHDQIQELKREQAMRKVVYPTQIKLGNLTRAEANRRFLVMSAAISSLERLNEKNTGTQMTIE